VALTPAGDTFRVHADKVLSTLLEAETAMKTIKDAKR
jgi:DNA-binding transcriptional LysR family regulator